VGYPHEETPFAEAVRKELRRARGEEWTCEEGRPETMRLLPGHAPQHSLHESYAVILEEVDELWDLVRLKKEDRDPAAVLKELVQIGAMAQRAAEDLALIPRS
jgi:hypothetical protein